MAGYGCMTGRPAPVSDRAPQPSAAPAAKPVQAPATAPASAPVAGAPETDPRPEFYTVKKGDTLYVIALDHGLDYKELAEWNGIENPNVIRIGQQLRLRAPASTVVTAPLKTPPKVEGRPVGGAAPAVAANEAVKSQPKAVKCRIPIRRSRSCRGRRSRPQNRRSRLRSFLPSCRRWRKPIRRPKKSLRRASEDDEKVAWGWPASGKVLTTFNESTNLKGIGIAGKLGQPVIASAPGKVLYSGDGIRGYGKLVIIKHNKVYISVYAHNQLLLVKEGQSVAKGQKIADMGASDADQVKLHFEIRRFGKPIDPLKLLPGDRPA